MQRTRIHSRLNGRRASRAGLIAGGLLLASNALAEQVSFQFSHTWPGGGTVTGMLVGEDIDGDGRLYSVAPGLADFLGIEAGGEEITYASVTIRGVLGEPVTNVFDASVADINDPSNFFWGFAYNLDGGALGDDDNEGVSFAPLAPSTSYIAGPLFSGAWFPGILDQPLVACGSVEDGACGGIVTLDPVDPFPNFELLFADTSPEPVVMHELLRYTFEQSGFDGGASITGTLSGRDLDGDGILLSSGAYYRDALGFPAGDEVVYASVTIRGMEPQAIVNKVDLTATDVLDPPNFFWAARVNVAGDQLGDEAGEGISIAPFSPSTSYLVGEAFSPSFSPVVIEQGVSDCGNEAGEPCGALVTLTPNPDVPTGVDVQATQYSAEPISLAAAPLVVDGTFSGHWFNELRTGEGVITQIIGDGRALVYWLTYDGSGKQRWIYGVGQRNGLKIEIDDLFVSDNGVFDSTMPVLVDLSSVGEMEIEFDGCRSGTVSFIVDGVPGTMEIGRLTAMNGLECVR